MAGKAGDNKIELTELVGYLRKEITKLSELYQDKPMFTVEEAAVEVGSMRKRQTKWRGGLFCPWQNLAEAIPTNPDINASYHLNSNLLKKIPKTDLKLKSRWNSLPDLIINNKIYEDKDNVCSVH